MTITCRCGSRFADADSYKLHVRHMLQVKEAGHCISEVNSDGPGASPGLTALPDVRKMQRDAAEKLEVGEPLTAAEAVLFTPLCAAIPAPEPSPQEQEISAALAAMTETLSDLDSYDRREADECLDRLDRAIRDYRAMKTFPKGAMR